MRRSRLSFLLAGSLVVIAASTASAQLTQVSTPGALNGPLTTHDFEAAPSGPGATYSINNSAVVHASACNYNQAGCVTPSGNWGLGSGNSFSTLRIDFLNPTRSVGLYFGNDDICCSSVFTAVLQAYDGSGLIGSVSLLANMNDAADQFLGFNSSTDVNHVELYYQPQSGNPLALYVDDVSFSSVTATPEPASLVLLGTGLVGIFGLARRRRSSSNE